MKRTVYFDNPYLLGFEGLEALLGQLTEGQAENYPPYNIAYVSEVTLRLSLAVAGFAPEDLEVVATAQQLSIRGKRRQGDGETYLHKGIATRQFARRFVLADGWKVIDASLEHGLLHVTLHRPTGHDEARPIPVRTGPPNDPPV